MKKNSIRGAGAWVNRPLMAWGEARSGFALAILLAVAIAAFGCSSKKKVDELEAADSSGDSLGEPLPPPVANITISYSRPNDSLDRVVVSKFFGAEVITNMQSRSGRTASVIRFDGGVPIWEIKADRSLAGRITDIGSAGWAVKQLEYGKLPPHFSQVIPDEGPPEPLDRGSFYVFQIERASGTISYEAVKVLADGSLEAYAAQPRAGSSYLLCCGLASDFSEPVILPEEISPEDQESVENAGGGDQSGGSPQGSSGGP